MILYFLIQFTKLSTDSDNFIFLVYLRFSLLLFYFQIYQFVQDDFQTCLKSKGFFLTIKLPIKFLVFYYISIKKYPIISIYLKSKGFFFLLLLSYYCLCFYVCHLLVYKFITTFPWQQEPDKFPSRHKPFNSTVVVLICLFTLECLSLSPFHFKSSFTTMSLHFHDTSFFLFPLDCSDHFCQLSLWSGDTLF